MAENAQDKTARRTPAQVRASIVGIVAGLVRWVGLVIVVILVVRVLLTVGGANPANGITSFITSWSTPLAWGFKDLFTPSDGKLRVLINYGIAALFWLVVSSIVVRIIRRLG
jgi:putative flippase GtrA